MNKDRKIYISKVKRFAKSKTGLAKLSKIAPDVANVIKEHPEYLDIAQYRNDPRVAGVYTNYIFGDLFYIGSSGNVFLRECEHCYSFIKEAEFYGHKYEPTIPCEFKPVAVGMTDPDLREMLEFNAIRSLKPILQWTDPDSPEFGTDKPISQGETRDSIRPDVCIDFSLRIKRFNMAQQKYNKKLKNVET